MTACSNKKHTYVPSFIKITLKLKDNYRQTKGITERSELSLKVPASSLQKFSSPLQEYNERKLIDDFCFRA